MNADLIQRRSASHLSNPVDSAVILLLLYLLQINKTFTIKLSGNSRSYCESWQKAKSSLGEIVFNFCPCPAHVCKVLAWLRFLSCYFFWIVFLSNVSQTWSQVWQSTRPTIVKDGWGGRDIFQFRPHFMVQAKLLSVHRSLLKTFRKGLNTETFPSLSRVAWWAHTCRQFEWAGDQTWGQGHDIACEWRTYHLGTHT